MKTVTCLRRIRAFGLMLALIAAAGPLHAQEDSSEESKAEGLLNRLFEKADVDDETKKKLEDATGEARKMLETEDAKDALKKAAEAFRENEGEIMEKGKQALKDPSALEGDTADLEGQARKLMDEAGESPALNQAMDALGDDRADIFKTGKEMLENAQGTDPAALRQAAEDALGNPALTEAAEKMVGREAVEEATTAAAQIMPLERKAPTEPGSPTAGTTGDAPETPGEEASMTPLIPLAPGEIPAPTDPVVTPIPREERDPSKLTRITAERSTFDSTTNFVTFEENVLLDHPEFDLTCEVLEAELAQEEPAEGETESAETAATTEATAQPAQASGIRRAVAKGYVQIEKITPEGKIQVAKSREAVYDSVTGDVLLTNFPMLQDGKNLIQGTSAATRIFLRSNGQYDVDGPARYEMVGNSNSMSLPSRPGN